MSLNRPGARLLSASIDAHDNGFNLVRLTAALLVVVYHAWQLNLVHPNGLDPFSAALQPVANLGELAVGVFFMISGMFVAQSWSRDPYLLRFALRRIARIVPGLFVCLCVTTLVTVCCFSDAGPRSLLGAAPWRYVFGNSVLHWLRYIIPPEELRLPGVLHGMDLNGPLWTLYWEGRMYVMLALIGVCALLPVRIWMTGVSLFLLLAANLMPDVSSGYLWEVRLWSLFLTGVLLFSLAGKVRVGPIQVACALVFVALNWTRNAAMTPSGLNFFGIALVCCSVALWIGTVRFKHMVHIQRHDYSFGVYIYHWPVMLVLRELFPALDALPMLAASLLAVLPLAMLSWHLVESPVLARARRALSNWRRKPG